jgi:hypothetical protein
MRVERNSIADGLILLRHEPLLFVRHVIGDEPRDEQERVLVDIGLELEAGRKHLKLLMRTCHGWGKTRLMAWLFLWYMFTRPGSRAITTAPTWRQVSNLLWREIKAAWLRSLLLPDGRVLDSCRLEIEADWFGYGVASDNFENLEGSHSAFAAGRFVDEAKAVPAQVIRATQGSLDAPETIDAWITTPWQKAGPFYELDTSPRTDVLRYVGTIEEMIRAGIPGAEHARDELAFACGGIDAPEFLARGMAQYLDDDGGAWSASPAAVDACMERAPSLKGEPRIGVDVAFSTDGDESVISTMIGDDLIGQVCMRIRDTVQISSIAVERARTAGARTIAVDAIGYGAGPVSEIKSWGWDGKVEEFVANAAANQPERFKNRSTEAAWHLVKRINERAISLPRDPILRSQILQVRFKPITGGKIELIKTPDGFSSPDRFDSLMIASAPPIYTGGHGYIGFLESLKQKRLEREERERLGRIAA